MFDNIQAIQDATDSYKADLVSITDGFKGDIAPMADEVQQRVEQYVNDIKTRTDEYAEEVRDIIGGNEGAEEIPLPDQATSK